MKKIKYKILALASTTASAISVVSCGAQSAKGDSNYSEIFKQNSNEGNEDDNKGSSDDFKVSKNAPLYNKIGKYWGIGRPSDLKLGESEPIGLKDRIDTGQPKEEGMNPEDMWNWIPIDNKTGDISSPDAFGSRYDFKDSDKYKPDVKTWFGNVDGEMNRATVPFQKYTHGEKLKPSQSSFGRMHSVPGFVRKNGDNNLGFLPTISDSKAAGYLSWQYTASATNWKSGPMQSITAPSPGIINSGHRNGVPVLGEMLMYERSSGESERQVEIITNEGQNKDYPIAKGMVEYALYVGFDGYFFDWESAATPSKVDGFVKAFNSYAKLGYYEDSAGNKHYIDNSTNVPSYIKKARDKYHYSWSPLMIAQYRYSISGSTDFFDMGDISLTEQNTRTSTSQNVRNLFHAHNYFDNKNSNLKRDIYNELVYASNWPEDGQASLANIMKNYYGGGIEDSNNVGKIPSLMSYWFWNYNGAYQPSMDREIFSSFAGDPRYYDELNPKGGFAFSNMIQEKTAIIGRKLWSTSFDIGSGQGLFLNGGKDLKNSTMGAGKTGWINPEMQSYLPTYQFISDFYDNGKLEDFRSFYNKQTHKLDYPVKVTLNNKTNSAWFGGTTLSYSGELKSKNKLINKLYASNVEVKSGDKFEVIYRNKDGSNSIKPNLSIWTHNGKVPISYYKNDGSEANKAGFNVGFKYSGGKNASGPLANLETDARLLYDKEESWDVQRKLNEISPTKEEKIKNKDGWYKLTFDISSLKGNSMMDFGLSFNNNKNTSINMDGVQVGTMTYYPVDYKKPTVEFQDMTTEKIWDKNVDTIKARVSFDTTIKGHEQELMKNHVSGKWIRYYMTFYSDENWNNIGLAWVGSNKEAYLNNIPVGTKKQNLQVYAISSDYKILATQKYQVKL